MEKVSSKETLFLTEMSKNLHVLFAAKNKFADGVCLYEVFTLITENSLIYLAGTRMQTVTMLK